MAILTLSSTAFAKKMKKIILFLLICFCLPVLNGTDAKSKKTRKYELVVAEAMKHVGTKYKYGGCAPDGFDCSGFVGYIYKKFGINLPRVSSQQADEGKRMSKSKAKKGDLIFFKGSNLRDKKVGHVGIVITDKGDDIKFVHASTSRGVVVSSLSTAYYKDRYKKIRCFKELNKKVK